MEKKRIMLYKIHGLTLRMDLGFLTDHGLLTAIDSISHKLNISHDKMIIFTLGTRKDMESGTKYFCPYCGAYVNEGYKQDDYDCPVCKVDS